MNQTRVFKELSWFTENRIATLFAAGLMIGLILLKSWMLAVGLLCVVLVSVFAVRSPLWVWLILIANMLFFLHYIQPPASTVLFWGMTTIFIFSVFFHHIYRREHFVWGDPFFWMALAGWFIWGSISTLLSADLTLSVREILRYGIMISVLLAYTQWFSNEVTLRLVLKGIWISLCLYALLMIAKKLLSSHWIDLILGSHWHSDVESAGFFVIFFPLYFSLIKYMRGLLKTKIIWLLVFFALIMVSGSNTAIISTLVGAMALLVLAKPRSGGKIVLFGFLAASGLMFIGLMQFEGFGDWMINHLSGRERIWPAAMNAAVSHPVFGIGPGHWSSWFGAHYLKADFIFNDLRGNTFILDPATLKGQAHNLFLTKAAEMGIPSVVLLLSVFVLWFRNTVYVYRLLPDGWFRDLVRGCLASFIGLTFFCLFENGPILGTAREGEVIFVTIIMAIPFAVERWYRQIEEAE